MSYDAFAKTFSQSRKNLQWEEEGYFVEYIKGRFPGKTISILDVGCGNGRFLETIESSGLPYSYLGTDASAGMIEEAQKLHPDNTFQVLDMNCIDELPSDKKYQFIVFIASFHHLRLEQERIEVLKKAKKLLMPWGVIMMTNWNLMSEPLFSKYRNGYDWNGDFRIKIGAHERYYHGLTTTELDGLFQECGYAMIENRAFEGGKNIVSILQTVDIG